MDNKGELKPDEFNKQKAEILKETPEEAAARKKFMESKAGKKADLMQQAFLMLAKSDYSQVIMPALIKHVDKDGRCKKANKEGI